MEKVRISELAVGSKFNTGIGRFIVLEQLEGSTKVITEGLYREYVQFGYDGPDYKESRIKKLCDGEIYDEFSNEFGADNIIEHEVDLTTVDMQKDYGKAICKVRPLTFDEARKYNNLLVKRDLPDWWWTCTSWSTERRGWRYSVAVVSPVGNIVNGVYGSDGGVRPVCILKSNILVSKED